MPNLSQKSPVLNHSELIQGLIFFILFYLWVWLKIDPRLIYHGGGVVTNFPVFYRGWSFFVQFILYPGGPLEYLCAFLSQFLYYSWAGALVITLSALLISLCTDTFIKAINANRLRWVRFIPPMLLLVTYNQYTYHFVTTMALLAALFFACLYLKVAKVKRPVSLIGFWVLSVILYYIAGGAYLLFAVLCALYELLFSRRWQMTAVYLLSAAVIPYIEGVLVFGVSIINAFGYLLPFCGKTFSAEAHKKMAIIISILYLLLPLTALAIGLWRIPIEKKIKEQSRSRILLWYAGSPVLRWFTELCLLLVLGGSVAFLSYDNKLKTILDVDYYACHRMWPQVLQAARRYPDNYLIVHTVNRALYHTGRLGYDMFSYPQHANILFLTGGKNDPLLFWKRFDICIDLGFMNKAEGDLTELLEIVAERPIILKRLALINMVKGNLGAARIYLGALSKTLFDADWANHYLALLQSDPNLSADDRIQHLRRLQPENDNESILSALSNKNKYDRIAFEYLMAIYLLTKQLDRFIQNLPLLKDFGYPELPTHYQEAILLYSLEKRTTVDLYGYRLSPELIQRSKSFADIFNRYREDKQAAFNKLAKDYGDSYFFYYTYGVSGMKK